MWQLRMRLQAIKDECRMLHNPMRASERLGDAEPDDGNQQFTILFTDSDSLRVGTTLFKKHPDLDLAADS